MLDPSKRLSVAQIKEHKWMVLEVPVQRTLLYQQPSTAEGDPGLGEYSEQVLRLMHSLGIDQHKTIEVRGHGLGAMRLNNHYHAMGFFFSFLLLTLSIYVQILDISMISVSLNTPSTLYFCFGLYYVQGKR